MSLIHEGAITFEAEGAFYNPRMILNRDISVAMAGSLGLVEYLDALSASGIRGLRVAREAGVPSVTINDISPQAAALMLANAARNALNCQVCCKSANVLLHEQHFQAVDLDPFGSPSPYLCAASFSARSYLFITATDTAPLCGAHLKSGIRKYLAYPLRSGYHREMGARILLGLAARELARWDKGVSPLLTHVTDHYVRTYLSLTKGAKAADKSLENMGYVEHCFACGSFTILQKPTPTGFCRHCQGKTDVAGPLWLGPLHDRQAIAAALSWGEKSSMLSARARRILSCCAQEIDDPMYYDHHNICERFQITPGRIEGIVQRLRLGGYRASRTHFWGLGIKTDASLGAVEEAIRQS